MKARNSIFLPHNTYLNPRIISAVLDLAKNLVNNKQFSASQDFHKKLNNFSYIQNSFLDLANAIKNEVELYSALSILINTDPFMILKLVKNEIEINGTPSNPPKQSYREPSKEKNSDSDEEEIDENEEIKLNSIKFCNEALAFSLALAKVSLSQKNNGKDALLLIGSILKSIAHIIKKNPEWADLKIQKEYFVDAMKFIIENSQDNLIIAKLIKQIDPYKKNSDFAFLHTQSGLISRTFTSSYVDIVDCAKKQILQNAKTQNAPNSQDEETIKSILKIETGMGKHAPEFFNHQPKHLEEYDKLLLEKRASFAPKPEH